MNKDDFCMTYRSHDENVLLSFADSLANQSLRLALISKESRRLDSRQQLRALSHHHRLLSRFLFSCIETRSVHPVCTQGDQILQEQPPCQYAPGFQSPQDIWLEHQHLIDEGKQYLRDIQTPELRLALADVLAALVLSGEPGTKQQAYPLDD